MTPERAQQVERIFLAVMGEDAGSRGAKLREMCAGDEDLRREIESLLAHHDPSSSFLDSSEMLGMVSMLPSGLAGVTGVDVALPAGAQVGSYTIVSQLGAGGMGVVYVAEQAKLRRTVALKLIRRDMATPSVLRRFETEAEILGRLQHPGIAQIFEAGTADWGYGPQPFFAMELVKGVPVHEHADRAKLATRDRLDLIARVCDAVQHAHQRGVIHRDLKPGNVLVNEPGEPKVLDFGVARLADRGQNTTTTLRTGVGQLIGTLAYMSPEQVEGDPREIDTRADVYALGVMLYELVSGRLPHDVRSRSIPEAARVIRDERPPKLSSIDRTLRGDIETIAAKALEKDKTRRYQSAADLAADLRRFLAGEPIEAKRDSAMYVLRKQLNRYRGLVALASAAVIAVSGLGVYAWRKAQREHDARVEADNERGVAQSARRAADTARDRLSDELWTSTVERGRLMCATGNMRWGEEMLWEAYLQRPGADQAHWALWEVYSREPCLWSRRTLHPRGRACAYTPDGRRIVSTGQEGDPCVWDAATGELLGPITGRPAHYHQYVFTPDNQTAFAIGTTGEIALWDLSALRCVGTLPKPEGEFVSGLAMVGDQLVAGTKSGRLLVWSVDGHEQPPEPRDLDGVTNAPVPVAGLAISPDRSLLAVGLENGQLRFYSWPELRVRSVADAHADDIFTMAFSPDGSMLATGSTDRVCKLWDPKIGALIDTIEPDNGTVRQVLFSPDSRTLVTVGWWRVDQWDTRTRQRLTSVGSRSLGAFGAAYSPSGDQLASMVDTGALRVWEVRTNLGARTFTAHARAPGTSTVAVLFGPDNRTLYSAGADGSLSSYELPTLRTTASTTIEGGRRASTAALSPDGQRLAVAVPRVVRANTAPDEIIVVLDSRTFEPILSVRGVCPSIKRLMYTPDGRSLVSAGGDQTVRVWDAATGELDREFDPGDGVGEAVEAVVSPDGSLLVCGHRRTQYRVWSFPDGQLLDSYSTRTTAWVGAFSPDSRSMAFGHWDQTVKIWTVGEREPRVSCSGHAQLVSTVKYFPHGRWLMSANTDGTIKIWDSTSGQCLTTLDTNPVHIRHADLSPDGRFVAAGHADGTVTLWDLRYYDRHVAGNRPYFDAILRPTTAPIVAPTEPRP